MFALAMGCTSAWSTKVSINEQRYVLVPVGAPCSATCKDAACLSQCPGAVSSPGQCPAAFDRERYVCGDGHVTRTHTFPGRACDNFRAAYAAQHGAHLVDCDEEEDASFAPLLVAIGIVILLGAATIYGLSNLPGR